LILVAGVSTPVCDRRFGSEKNFSGPCPFLGHTAKEIERKIAMKSTGPINVMFAASVSAALVGGLAVLFVPTLAFFYLAGNNRPTDGGTEFGMILAVATPFCCAAAGFMLGAIMASIANMLAEPSFRPVVVRERAMEAYAGSAIDAA
jgi:hypothetical protein